MALEEGRGDLRASHADREQAIEMLAASLLGTCTPQHERMSSNAARMSTAPCLMLISSNATEFPNRLLALTSALADQARLTHVSETTQLIVSTSPLA